jgi:hypothetical protein
MKINRLNRKSIILSALFFLPFLQSCEDFLDKAPSSDLAEEAVFKDYRLFKEYVDGLYPFLWYTGDDFGWTTYAYGGFCRLQLSCLEDATDLSDGARSDCGVRTGFNMGDWNQNSALRAELVFPWKGGYSAIRKANRILDHVDIIEGLTDEERAHIKGQALFFRGFFHHEMLKRYGEIPYVDKTYNVSEDMDLVRDTYSDCVEKMCRDFEEAAALLPPEFPESELGRPEKGAALGFKARTLLYAASPLNNESGDIALWQKAAEAAYAVIALNRYSLVPKNDYRRIFYGQPTNSEVLFLRNGGPGGWATGDFSLPGWGSFGLGVSARPWSDEYGSTPCPTQNLLDMYEMDNGEKPILGYTDNDGTKPIINPASGYSEAKMYERRDPRFYTTFLINGEPWLDATGGIELFFDESGTPGKHIRDDNTWTQTGYLEKKFWDPILSPSSGTTYMNWIYLRYTDILLIYAEAMNETFGPDADGLGKGLTARQAVNSVRNRVGMADVKAATKEELRERIQNERAIEFVYEDQRWFDVIRWKKGVEIFNRPVYGIRTIKLADGTFRLERRKVRDRVFKDYMHRYPIPRVELNKSKNLVNNPQWDDVTGEE